MKKREVRVEITSMEDNFRQWIDFSSDNTSHTVMGMLDNSIEKMTFAYFAEPSAQKISIMATVLAKRKQVGTMRIVLSTRSVCTYAKRTKCCDTPFCNWRTDEIRDLLSILPKESCISFWIYYEDGSAEEHTWKKI